MKYRFPDQAPDDSRAEEIFIIEALDRLDKSRFVQARVRDIRQLMAGLVTHGRLNQSVGRSEVMKLRSGQCVSDRYLNGFGIEALGKINGPADGFGCFTWQAYDEVALNRQAQLLAIVSESQRHFNGGAFLAVLQDLGVARFITNNQETAARFLHSFQRFIVRRHPRGARPGELQRLELRTEFNGASLLIIESIVVEKDLL